MMSEFIKIFGKLRLYFIQKSQENVKLVTYSKKRLIKEQIIETLTLFTTKNFFQIGDLRVKKD